MTPQVLAGAYALDLVAGDPEWLPHPVRGFGMLIRDGEWALRRVGRGPAQELVAGAVLTASVVSIAWMSGRFRWLAWTTLATRSVLNEASAVIRALESADMERARVRLGANCGPRHRWPG